MSNNWKKGLMKSLYEYGLRFKHIADDYLKNERKITVEHDLVYVPQNINLLLKYLRLYHKNYSLDNLKQLGVVTIDFSKNKPVQRLYGIMIPHYNRFGEIIFATFRNIINNEWRYLNSRDTNKYPYNIFNCDTTKPLYVTEGVIDALSLKSLGINNVVSIATNNFQEQHKPHIKKFKKVIFCPDKDNGGKIGAINSYWKLKSWNIDIDIRFCKGEDINFMIQSGYSSLNEILSKPFIPTKKSIEKKYTPKVDKNIYLWYNNKIRVEDVVNKFNLRGNGNQYVCPAKHHKDKDPSLYLYKSKNEFFCFGCRSTGGSVRLIKLCLGLPLDSSSDIEAFSWIEKNFKIIYTGAIENEYKR